MKKIIITLLFVVICNIISAQDLQVWKYRVKSISIRERENGKWQDWIDSKDNKFTEALVALDLPNKRLDIYLLETNQKITYYLTYVYPSREDTEGSYFKMDGIDKNNNSIRFYLTFLARKKKEPILDIEKSDSELLLFMKTEY